MEATLTCDVCGEQFVGRPNKKHCSLKCRRDIERRRRYWDSIGKYIQMCEYNAAWDKHPERVREEWRKRAEGARERREKRFGARP